MIASAKLNRKIYNIIFLLHLICHQSNLVTQIIPPCLSDILLVKKEANRADDPWKNVLIILERYEDE